MKLVAVTGGDVSGKSASWEQLSERLKRKILQVPEIATALMSHALPALGRDIEVTPERLAAYQSVIRPTQLVAEEAWKMVALALAKSLIWCDRGIPDMVAYDPGGWPSIEGAYGMTKAEIYGRYNHVIVLRSLATVNPELYLEELKKNPARAVRTVEEAQALDRRTFDAWKDHPGLIDIDCYQGFDAVVRQIEAALRRILSLEIEKKLVLPGGLPNFDQFEKVITLEQEQFYLVVNEDGELRVREQVMENGPTDYIMTTKGAGTLSRFEHEDEDYPSEGYRILFGSRIGSEICKTRRLCSQNGQIFEVDDYRVPEAKAIVEVNFDDEAQANAFTPPAWMVGAIDVTDDLGYKAKNVALNGKFPELVAT